MSREDELNSIEHEIQKVGQLQPRRTDLDSRLVFYRAGFAACQSELASRKYSGIPALVAASLLAMTITGGVGYRIGRTRAGSELNSTRVAETQRLQPRPETMAAPDPHAIETAAVPDTAQESGEPLQATYPALVLDWLPSLGDFALSAKLKREANSTLTVSHSSIVSRQQANWAWPESRSETQSAFVANPLDHRESTSMQALAISDTPELAISLETRR